jgi:hypothetical protein
MKIVLDESVPQKLRLLLEGGNTVVTASFQGWSGLKNGELLHAAEEATFDLLITADQSLRYQQNLTGRKLALLLSTNNWAALRLHVSVIMAATQAATPGSCTELEIPFEKAI